MTGVTAQSLFWITLGALFVPILSRRLKVPSAVGELIYGILFGSHILGLITPDKLIDFMSQIGFAILMFSAGMEIDFAPIRRKGSKLMSTAWAWVIVTLIVALTVYALAGINYWAVLAVSSVSIGLASVVLKERRLLGERLGQMILAAGLIGETASILILTVLEIHYRLGFSLEFFRSLFFFAGIFVLAYLILRFFRFVIWWSPSKLLPFLEEEHPLELGVRLAVALMFIFVAAAALLGVEAILGAFIAGALFGYIFQEREVVAEKISGMGQGFFVPLFFIVVGSHFDPASSLEAFPWELFVLLLSIALVVKLIPSLLFLRVKLSWRENAAAGFLLASPLTLTVAVAEVGDRLGAITEEMKGIIILVAVAAGIVYPFLARLILPSSKEEEAEKNL